MGRMTSKDGQKRSGKHFSNPKQEKALRLQQQEQDSLGVHSRDQQKPEGALRFRNLSSISDVAETALRSTQICVVLLKRVGQIQ